MPKTLSNQGSTTLLFMVTLLFVLLLTACGGTQQPAEQTPAATETLIEPTNTEDKQSTEPTEPTEPTNTKDEQSTKPTEPTEPTNNKVTIDDEDNEDNEDDKDDELTTMEPEEVINTASGLTFTPPLEWKATNVGADILVESPNETRLFLTISSVQENDLIAMGIEDAADTTNELLLTSFANQQGMPTISDKQQQVTIDGYAALIADMDMTEQEESTVGKILVCVLEDERAFLLLASFSTDDWDEDLFMSMLDTISFLEPESSPVVELPTTPEPTTPEPTTPEPTAQTPSIVSSDNIAIVIGAQENRLSVLSGDTWITPNVGDVDMESCLVGSAFFDADGKPWVGCASLLMTSYDSGATWEEIPVNTESLFTYRETTAYNVYDNTIWLLEDDLITVIDAASEQVVASYDVAETTREESFPTELITFAPDGQVWLGGMNLNGSELVAFDGTIWTAYGKHEDIGLESYESPDALHITKEGELWVLTSSAVYAFADGTLTKIIPASSLIINDVVVLENGDMWVATYGGIALWDGSTWSNITAEDGLPSERIKDLTSDAAGTVWVATDYGLAVQDGSGGWNIALPSTSGIAESRIAAIAVRGTPTLPTPSDTPSTGSLRGRILYADAPLAGTSVQVCGEDGTLFFAESPCEDVLLNAITETDDTGGFFFADLPLSTYHLYALNPNGADGPEWIDVTFLTGINILDEGIEIEAGDFDLANEDATGDGDTSDAPPSDDPMPDAPTPDAPTPDTTPEDGDF